MVLESLPVPRFRGLRLRLSTCLPCLPPGPVAHVTPQDLNHVAAPIQLQGKPYEKTDLVGGQFAKASPGFDARPRERRRDFDVFNGTDLTRPVEGIDETVPFGVQRRRFMRQRPLPPAHTISPARPTGQAQRVGRRGVGPAITTEDRQNLTGGLSNDIT